MNTTKTTDLSEFNADTDVLRAIALHLHNGGDYFIIRDGDAFIVYEGDNTEQIDLYLNHLSENNVSGDDYDFAMYCAENCTEIELLEADDERDGYICLTDDEAETKCAEYIKDSLWAFNADFIIQHSKLPYEAKEMIESFQRDKCEGANDTIEAIIEDVDGFIDAAISADGRGHFMNTYDGHENEQETDVWGLGDNADERFYIYRMN